MVSSVVRKLPSSKHYNSLLLPGTVALFILLVVFFRPGSSTIATLGHNRDSGCQVKFKRYVPSPWEKEWWSERKKLQNDQPKICEKLSTDIIKATEWLIQVQKHQEKSELPKLDEKLFSKFVYEDTCNGERTVYIEPLTAHFRHPWALPRCLPDNKEPVHVEARDYLLVHGMDRETTEAMYPGKKYLFDMGTSWFHTSLKAFIEFYRMKGIEFDEIWAWEVLFLNQTQYWDEVPTDIKSKLHLYNVPVSSNSKDGDNPLNIIRSKAQPGDFVALKLDIDNSPIELSFIDQIEKDAKLKERISEMMFEMHYNSPVIWDEFFVYAGSGFDKTWQQVFEQFESLRKSGLRIHYWP